MAMVMGQRTNTRAFLEVIDHQADAEAARVCSANVDVGVLATAIRGSLVEEIGE